MLDGKSSSNGVQAKLLTELGGEVSSRLDMMRDQYQARNDYQAAKPSDHVQSLTGVVAGGSGADHHYRIHTDFWRMIEEARRADRNNMIIGQGLNRLVRNVLQGGLPLDAKTGDGKLDKWLTDRWKDWTEDPRQCHASAERGFHQQAAMVLRAVIVDGDMFTNPLRNGTLEHIEAHRARTPADMSAGIRDNTVHGIELNQFRRHVRYWFTKDDVGLHSSFLRGSSFNKREVWDANFDRRIWFHACPKRVTQTRGVTAFAPISQITQMHDDLHFLKMVQSTVTSYFCLIESYKDDAQAGPPNATQLGPRENRLLADGTTKRIEKPTAGTYYEMAPGKQLEAFNANVPNTEFFKHTMLVLSIIAVNLDMPVQMLLLDPTQTNFSGWRGAIDQARQRFRELADCIVRSLYRPVYLWKLRDWLQTEPELRALTGATIGPDGVARMSPEMSKALSAHDWIRPTYPYIEPKKDAEADVIRLDNRLTSPRRQTAERGGQWAVLSREISEDRALHIRNAIKVHRELIKTHPEAETLPWQYLLSDDSAMPVAPMPVDDAADDELDDKDTDDGKDEES